MLDASQYELLDFGDGRKLEQFGGYLLDRPCPAAEGIARKRPDSWGRALARYDRTRGELGQWTIRAPLPEPWTISHGGLRLALKPTEFGHVGVFPEQAENWHWIAEQIRRAARPPSVLNLFAYTGASTLVAAVGGAAVTHVDAAQSTVNWARQNAELSSLGDAPIRWIAEDALKFARREIKRGHSYDAVILDPPSYGHGPHGEIWKLTEHLPELLALCAQLTAGAPEFMLLTCHTAGIGPRELKEFLVNAIEPKTEFNIELGELSLTTNDHRSLNSGSFARIARR